MFSENSTVNKQKVKEKALCKFNQQYQLDPHHTTDLSLSLVITVTGVVIIPIIHSTIYQ